MPMVVYLRQGNYLMLCWAKVLHELINDRSKRWTVMNLFFFWSFRLWKGLSSSERFCNEINFLQPRDCGVIKACLFRCCQMMLFWLLLYSPAAVVVHNKVICFKKNSLIASFLFNHARVCEKMCVHASPLIPGGNTWEERNSWAHYVYHAYQAQECQISCVYVCARVCVCMSLCKPHVRHCWSQTCLSWRTVVGIVPDPAQKKYTAC